MRRVLVTGALGQIGSELITALRERYGADQVVMSDIRMPPVVTSSPEGPFEFLDCTQLRQLQGVVQRYDVGIIYHLAALLSAVAEEKPQLAWNINSSRFITLYRASWEVKTDSKPRSWNCT